MLVPFLLLSVLLLPPYIFVGSVVRLQRKIGWTEKSSALSAGIIVGLLFSAANTAFVILNFGKMASGSLTVEPFFIAALMISWVCLVGKIAMRTLLRHKRRRY